MAVIGDAPAGPDHTFSYRLYFTVCFKPVFINKIPLVDAHPFFQTDFCTDGPGVEYGSPYTEILIPG